MDLLERMYEGKGVLEIDETESLTGVIMEQKEGLLTGKERLHSEEHLSVYGGLQSQHY